MQAESRCSEDGSDSATGKVRFTPSRRAEGSFYAFVRITGALQRLGLPDDQVFCDRLLEAEGLALVPGSGFGAPGHVRLSFATSRAQLEAALERLGRFLRSA